MSEIFGKFGKVTSVVISRDSKGRRFGFVNYDACDAAKAAVDTLHGKRCTDEGVSMIDNDL